MPYTIEQLVDDRNRALYEAIIAKVTLELIDEPHEDGAWGSQYFEDRKLAQISYAPADAPQASFAHELLHIKFEMEGFKRPNYNVAAKKEEYADYARWANGFLGYCYNQLMHIKMFPEFVKMGYPPMDFLRRNPNRIKWIKDRLSEFKGQIKQKSSNLDLETYARTYLVLRNPHDPSPEIPKLLKEMKQINSGRFNRLEKLVDEWVADESPNVSEYLARLFYFAGHPNVAVGHTKETLIWAKSFAPEKN